MHSLRISSERPAEVAIGVLLHLGEHQLLVERAAVDADAHRRSMVDRDLADRGELLVAPRAGAHVSGIDAVLVERLGAVGIARQEEVAVVVEVADERRRAAGVEHALLDLGHGGRGFRHVHRDADHLGAGLGQLDALAGRRRGISRVGQVMDCTTTGAPPPTCTRPTRTPTVR
jgi:hypothetical protein